VERAVAAARNAGARRAVTLPVSVPSHCALMVPAAELFAARLDGTEIGAPAVPVIQNVDACVHADPADIRENLARQLYNPVQWVGTVRTMHAQGITRIIEAGPGKVLTGLNKRIDSTLVGAAVQDPASLDAALDDNG